MPSIRLNPYILLVIAPLLWAGNFVVGRGVHELVNPWALTLMRWSLAAVVLGVWAAPQAWRARDQLWQARWTLLGLSVTGVILFQAVLYEAVRTTPAINGAVIMATMPILIPVVSYFMFEAVLTRMQALGIAVSMLGALVVVARADLNVFLTLSITPGDALVLSCVVFWSLYSNLLRKLPTGLPPAAVLWVTAVLGVMILLPIAGYEATVRPAFEITAPIIWAVVYVGLGPSIIAFLCWNVGVAGVGPTKAGLFIHLIPVFTVVFATTLLGETLQHYHFIGAAIVAIGIIMVSRGKEA